jgi:hypothetical protein
MELLFGNSALNLFECRAPTKRRWRPSCRTETNPCEKANAFFS